MNWVEGHFDIGGQSPEGFFTNPYSPVFDMEEQRRAAGFHTINRTGGFFALENSDTWI
jgi:hypothetical protein